MNKQRLKHQQKKNRRLHRSQKVCHIWKQAFKTDDSKYYNIKEHCYYTGNYIEAAHVVCSKKSKTRKEIPVVFHNGSTYDYHFIIKKLVKEFKS